MLSLIPPSTETYRRCRPAAASTCLTVPTSYRVTAAGPATARPGSTASRGTGRPATAHSRSTMPRSDPALGPAEHRLPRSAPLGGPGQPGYLGERVDHDPADAGIQRALQLGDRLVVAVQRDAVGRKARPARRGQLAAAAHVQA